MSDKAKIDYYALWNLDATKDFLIMASSRYGVWLDSAGDLDWETKEDLDLEIVKTVGQLTTSRVLNQAAILRAYPVDHLACSQNKNFHIMIGEGLARLFEFDAVSAKEMFEEAAKYGIARNQEVARCWYLIATGLTTGIFSIILSTIWLWRESLRNAVGATALSIGLAACIGAVGAFLSVLSRIGNSPLDPSAGRTPHYVEATGRVLIGSISAATVLLAIKIGLGPSILNDKGIVGIALIAILSGFSEKFAPTIIKRVEMSVIRNPSETTSDKQDSP